MARVLLIIDIQNDYFAGGAYPLVGSDAAAEAAARAIAAFREAGDAVLHVQHVWDAPDAVFMRPGTEGVEIHEAVRPLDGEPVLQKAEPNAFLGTDLAERLAQLTPDELVVAGMMTSMCVDSTVRAAAERGFAVRVLYDACAAPDLEFGGQRVPGAAVHTAFIAALADGFAAVSSVDVYLAGV
ncbi:cysteine hydrolase family protein [Leucobacter sp. VD1]|uniref:cysteine hydrolase family protein n=1 Tax=Leucobacter sp. VD1 TaxID=3080381 RepID=UPI003018E092